MPFDDRLLDLDYLVFSSHKTATQTIAHTLRTNGYRCTHCHTVKNDTLNLAPGTFGTFAEVAHRRNGRKLHLISVFREPIERSVSSFFQRHGTDVVRLGLRKDVCDTVIHRESIEDLQRRFRWELALGRLTGKSESIPEICRELGITFGDLNFDTTTHRGTVETDHCVLHLLRFDSLIHERRLQGLLSQITGKPLVQHDRNVSASKWYHDRLRDFAASLRLPRRTIVAAYRKRAGLFDLFYPGEFDAMLFRALVRYG